MRRLSTWWGMVAVRCRIPSSTTWARTMVVMSSPVRCSTTLHVRALADQARQLLQGHVAAGLRVVELAVVVAPDGALGGGGGHGLHVRNITHCVIECQDDCDARRHESRGPERPASALVRRGFEEVQGQRSARSAARRRARTMKPIPSAVPRPRATPAQMPASPSELSTTPTRSNTGRSTLIQVMASPSPGPAASSTPVPS